MESPLSCRVPSPGEGRHRSFMGVEARVGQADLQTWLWWEADRRHGQRWALLGLLSAPPGALQGGEEGSSHRLRKNCLVSGLWEEVAPCTSCVHTHQPSAITLTWELAENALCSNLLDQNLMVNNPQVTCLSGRG